MVDAKSLIDGRAVADPREDLSSKAVAWAGLWTDAVDVPRELIRVCRRPRRRPLDEGLPAMSIDV